MAAIASVQLDLARGAADGVSELVEDLGCQDVATDDRQVDSARPRTRLLHHAADLVQARASVEKSGAAGR